MWATCQVWELISATCLLRQVRDVSSRCVLRCVGEFGYRDSHSLNRPRFTEYTMNIVPSRSTEGLLSYHFDMKDSHWSPLVVPCDRSDILIRFRHSISHLKCICPRTQDLLNPQQFPATNINHVIALGYLRHMILEVKLSASIRLLFFYDDTVLFWSSENSSTHNGCDVAEWRQPLTICM